jgi:hypothetical protein
MQERKPPGPNRAVTDSGATSEETLADIENDEQVTDSEAKNSEGSEIPSPDGAPDERDEPKDAGPM